MIRIDWGRKFIDIGRYRYRFLKIDMEAWRDSICPVCEQGFKETPTLHMMSYAIHWDCADTDEYTSWVEATYGEQASDEIDPSLAAEYAYAEAWKETESQNDWY